MEKQKQKLPSFSAIQEEIQTILETYNGADGENGEYSMQLTDEQRKEIDSYLEMLGTQEAAKVDGFAQYIRIREAQAKALKAEADRLMKRARTMENTMNYLKAKYLGIMEKHGLTKVSGNAYTISRLTRKIVKVVDEKLIPPMLMRENTTREPIKQDIMALLKIGKDVPGCQLSESTSLQVR